MKRLFLVGVLSLSSVAVNAGMGQYKKEFDAQKGEVNYQWTGLDEIKSPKGYDVDFGKIFAMRYSPDRSSSMDIDIYTVFRNTQGDNSSYDCKIKWFLDGRPFNGGYQIHNAKFSSVSNFTFLTKQEFGKFAGANKIEYDICGQVREFDAFEMEGIQRVYNEYESGLK